MALKSDEVAEKSKDQLSRDFPGRSIFDFCNNIGQSLQVLCRRARCEVRFDPKTDLILTPNPVATCLLRKLHYRRPSS